MNVLNGINQFLTFINNNWTSILVLCGLLLGLGLRIKAYFSKSKEERFEAIKLQIKESLLKMVTDAEMDFEKWKGAGAIKRSQVIKQIFDQYPILNLLVDQQKFINWVDEEIDNALKTLSTVINNNEKTSE